MTTTHPYTEPHAGQPEIARGTVRLRSGCREAVFPAKVVQGKDGFPHVLRQVEGKWYPTPVKVSDTFEPAEPDYKALYEGLRARIEKEITIAEYSEVNPGIVFVRFLKEALKEPE